MHAAFWNSLARSNWRSFTLAPDGHGAPARAPKESFGDMLPSQRSSTDSACTSALCSFARVVQALAHEQPTLNFTDLVGPLVPMLSSTSALVRNGAAMALGQIAESDEASCQLLLEAGALEVLVENLEAGGLEATYAIAAMTRNERACIALIQTQALPLLSGLVISESNARATPPATPPISPPATPPDAARPPTSTCDDVIPSLACSCDAANDSASALDAIVAPAAAADAAAASPWELSHELSHETMELSHSRSMEPSSSAAAPPPASGRALSPRAAAVPSRSSPAEVEREPEMAPARLPVRHPLRLLLRTDSFARSSLCVATQTDTETSAKTASAASAMAATEAARASAAAAYVAAGSSVSATKAARAAESAVIAMRHAAKATKNASSAANTAAVRAAASSVALADEAMELALDLTTAAGHQMIRAAAAAAMVASASANTAQAASSAASATASSAVFLSSEDSKATMGQAGHATGTMKRAEAVSNAVRTFWNLSHSSDVVRHAMAGIDGPIAALVRLVTGSNPQIASKAAIGAASLLSTLIHQSEDEAKRAIIDTIIIAVQPDAREPPSQVPSFVALLREAAFEKLHTAGKGTSQPDLDMAVTFARWLKLGVGPIGDATKRFKAGKEERNRKVKAQAKERIITQEVVRNAVKGDVVRIAVKGKLTHAQGQPGGKGKLQDESRSVPILRVADEDMLRGAVSGAVSSREAPRPSSRLSSSSRQRVVPASATRRVAG